MCHTSRRTQSQSHPSSSLQQHKVVQEVIAHDDQNTGNKTKNVDIVEMIRSMGLHAKNPLQIANVQEMSIIHVEDTKPVFYSPVQPMIVMTIWDQVCSVMDPEVCVATPVEHCIFESKKINMITVHDMELKSAHYSNVTINGQMVQVKQDTGAEVNIMSKCVFDRLSNSSTTRNSVLLNRTKTVKISGYGENSIKYIGMCVFKVSHNNQQRDVLFFITNVNDAKVILGAKSCQEFNLVKIVCDDKCSCKTSEIMSINQEFPVGLSVPNAKPKIVMPPVDLNMKIDVT